MKTYYRFNLIYYKNLIDKVFIKFFELYNNDFQKINNKYILSKNINKSKLIKIFEILIFDELKKIIKPYNILQPQYYLILGSCIPAENFLLKLKDSNKYFPEKLTKIILNKFQFKYILKEKDIQLDIIKFNSVIEMLFNKFFCKNLLIKKLGTTYKNVIFIKHQNLDCYSLFKIIKALYGKSNCWNIYKEKFKNDKSPLIAINDLIDKYIHNKQNLNKNKEFVKIIKEISEFLNEKMKDVINE